MVITINDLPVANNEKIFYYVSRWSRDESWGPSRKPEANESVQVPRGMHLLVDEDVPPMNLIIIEEGGSMIFECNEGPPA